MAAVTGGNRGIGREVGRQLAARGYRVVLGARREDDGRQAAEAIGPGARAHALDVSDAGSVAAFARWLDREHGRLDVLVNNAGVGTTAGALEVDAEEMRATFETNTVGPLLVTQALLPLLRRSPHARVVNVSSGGGSLADMTGGDAAYRVSKAGLNALTRILASELAGTTIKVNSVCPGWARTDMGGANAPRSVEEAAASVVWAATLPDDGPTGGFFRDGRPLAW